MKNKIKYQYAQFSIILISITIIYHAGCAGQVDDKMEISDSKVTEKPLPPTNKLAPGTVKIEARMIDSSQEAEHFDCILQVEKVLAYGRGVKPIGKGKEIFLQISREENDIVNLLSEGLMDQKYEFIVEQEEVVSMSDNQMRWRVLEVRKIVSNQ